MSCVAHARGGGYLSLFECPCGRFSRWTKKSYHCAGTVQPSIPHHPSASGHKLYCGASLPRIPGKVIPSSPMSDSNLRYSRCNTGALEQSALRRYECVAGGLVSVFSQSCIHQVGLGNQYSATLAKRNSEDVMTSH